MAAKSFKFGIPVDMGLLEIINFRLEQLAEDPVVLINGNTWYNTVEHCAKRVENGVIVPFFTVADAEKLASYEQLIEDAQTDADTAIASIAEITDNDILLASEKPVIKNHYDLLIDEQTEINTIAILYGVTTELTDYNNYVTALTSYINAMNPAITDYENNTTIDGSLFRGLFSDVYISRQTLTNALSTYAYNTLEEAMAVATEAQNVATQAAEDAAEAVAAIGVVANDAILARQEKPAVVQQYNVIIEEQAGIHAEADRFGITTELTDYEDAITALTTYLGTLDPAWDLYTEETPITREEFNDAFELVYSTRQILKNAITAEIGTVIYSTATKSIPIGFWNMDTTDYVSIAHGIADYTKIISITVFICDDTGVLFYSLQASEGLISFNAAFINIMRKIGGFFDSVSFNAAALDRGVIKITYDNT